MHLGGDDSASEDTSTDRHEAGEGALLVDVRALNRGLGRTEAQTNVLVPSPVASVLAGSADLVVQEDVRLSCYVSLAEGLDVAAEDHPVPASGKRAQTGLCISISEIAAKKEQALRT